MYWVCTSIFTGMFLAIGWRLGVIVYSRLETIIKNTFYVIRKNNRRKKINMRNRNVANYYLRKERGF